jgi:ABC transport system ATP-binding/permease protein
MNLLSVEKLTKSYGERDAFRDLNFGLAQGDKVALVARNGTGKTTLLRILVGEDTPDAGLVVWRTGIKVAYLTQDPNLPADKTVLEALLQSDDPKQLAVRTYEAVLNKQPEDPNEQDAWAVQLQTALDEVERLEAWDVEAQVKTILQRLQVGALTRLCGQLSGGQRKRAALAQVLLSRPDVLILDEPTNHLDLDMIEWLEDYLTQSDLTLLLVTHDRYFLDNICTRIFELEGGKMYTYEGNYEYFLEKKNEREQSALNTATKARSLLRGELEWLRRMPKARTTKSKARIESVAELQEKARSGPKEEPFELQVKMSPIGGKILDVKNITHQLGDLQIVKNLTYSFRRGERMGIVGRNGVGKTTLLNMLMGIRHPDAGQIDLGESIVPGYFKQDGLTFKPGIRVIDLIKDIAEALPLADGGTVRAEQFLLYFHFSHAQQQQPVDLLSGGERRRLHLLTVLIKNPNLLILDEPTNDLDLVTLQALEQFLLHFKGVLIVVSHDRYFLDRLVDHLWVMPGGGEVQDFNGNYRQWREAQEQAEHKKRQDQLAAAKAPAPVVVKVVEKRKRTFQEQKELETLEAEMERLEKRKVELEAHMSDANQSHEKVLEFTNEFGETERELERKLERWFVLTEE